MDNLILSRNMITTLLAVSLGSLTSVLSCDYTETSLEILSHQLDVENVRVHGDLWLPLFLHPYIYSPFSFSSFPFSSFLWFFSHLFIFHSSLLPIRSLPSLSFLLLLLFSLLSFLSHLPLFLPIIFFLNLPYSLLYFLFFRAFLPILFFLSIHSFLSLIFLIPYHLFLFSMLPLHSFLPHTSFGSAQAKLPCLRALILYLVPCIKITFTGVYVVGILIRVIINSHV